MLIFSKKCHLAPKKIHEKQRKPGDILISYSNKFIFIHIYKNAGTSMLHALQPFGLNPMQKAINRVSKRLLKREFYNQRPWQAHIRSSEIIKKIGKKTFQSYFTFAFVRNPWDWQVSLYSYMLKNTRHHQHELVKSLNNFDEYIVWRCREEVRFQKDFVCSEDNTILVNYIGRFENLENDFSHVCSQVGIQASLPKKNVSNTRPYQDFYNSKTIELVKITFKPDIDLFQYEFES